MKTNHTDGPWIFGKAPVHPIFTIGPLIKLSDDTSDIAEIATARFGFYDEEQVMANARLLAAAPELLSALEEIVSEEMTGQKLDITQARAAIAKARGRD